MTVESPVLFETICVMDGRVQNLAYHQHRVDRSQKELFSLEVSTVNLIESIKVPDSCFRGKFKCRVAYDREIISVNFEKYLTPVIRTLQMVRADALDYRYKYVDRSEIEKLFSLRGVADDILIVRDGHISDTSYANVCFYCEETGWFTPDTPLLEGTMRDRLIRDGFFRTMEITVENLVQFQKLSLVNAMLPPGEIEIPVSGISTL